MSTINQDSYKELDIDMKLGQVAMDRCGMYQLLAIISRYPTIELAKGLLNGTFHSDVKGYVQWVNENSGIFDKHLAQLNEFAQNKHDEQPEELLKNMEREFTYLFSNTEDARVLPYEPGNRQSLNGLLANSMDKAKGRAEVFATSENLERLDHISTKLDFLMFLCKKEGQAWQNGKMPKAKQWRRKERDFMENHLGKWGESYFFEIEKSTNLEVYHILASLGQTYMRLEKGY